MFRDRDGRDGFPSKLVSDRKQGTPMAERGRVTVTTDVPSAAELEQEPA